MLKNLYYKTIKLETIIYVNSNRVSTEYEYTIYRETPYFSVKARSLRAFNFFV